MSSNVALDGKYVAYSEYKSSGHQFVGEIPSTWTRRIVGSVSSVIDPQPDHRAPAISNNGEGFPYIGIRDVNKDGTLNFETARPVEEAAVIKQENSFTIEPHNIVFCKVGTLGIPRKVIPHGRCALSATLVLIKAHKGFNSQYLLYALDSDVVTSQTNYLATGSTRAALGIQQIRKFQIPIPSGEEQEKIANFLDHETAKIDILIAKQQRLIKLLKEKRQAVISHAVSKGLDPDVPMRDSGVEWLRNVPEHWGLTRAKFVSDVFVPQRNKPELNDFEGTSWATMEDMKNEYIETTKHFVSERESKVAGSKTLKSGSVIASCVGNFGVASINKTEVIINQQLQAFIPTRIKAEYLREIVSISTVYFDLVGTAATLVYVNQQGFENLPVLVPPISEQNEICTYVDRECSKFDKLVNHCELTQDLLHERRTALISAAVTGKIDVRNWQAPETSASKTSEALV